MAIFIIRHSDKEPGEFYSEGLPLNDQPLSAAGRAKAAALVGFFDGIEIASVRVSEYVRTRQTIQALAESRGLPVEADGRLNEINTGFLERLGEAEIEEKYPEFWEAYLSRDRDFRFPGGESGEEASSRALAVLGSLDTERNHILVSHDGLIRTLICAVLSLPPYKRHLFSVDTCSLSEFDYDERFACWRIARVNQSARGAEG